VPKPQTPFPQRTPGYCRKAERTGVEPSPTSRPDSRRARSRSALVVKKSISASHRATHVLSP